MDDKDELLNRLRFELGFIELGGYTPTERDLQEELAIFVNSPSCINYDAPAKEHPCSECWLIQFVPRDKRSETVPCHHIPLNERGETVADLAAGDSGQAQQALRDWLRATIKKLESTPPATGS